MSVFVWIETFSGRAVSSSWEAIGAARDIAEALDTDVTVLVFGPNAASIAAEAGRRGVANALVCADDSLQEYRLETYAALLSEIVAERRPRVVVSVATNRGRELLASAAADTNSGLISEVIDMRLEGGKIIGTRPAYAGKVLMELTSHTDTTFVTIRGRAFPAPATTEDAAAAIEEVAAIPVPDAIQTHVLDFASEAGQVNLTDAAIIVSGGRGMANNPAAPPADISGEAAMIWKAKDGYTHNPDALGGGAWRRYWRKSSCCRRWLHSLPASSRTDRQGRQSRPVYRLRYQRRDYNIRLACATARSS